MSCICEDTSSNYNYNFQTYECRPYKEYIIAYYTHMDVGHRFRIGHGIIIHMENRVCMEVSTGINMGIDRLLNTRLDHTDPKRH